MNLFVYFLLFPFRAHLSLIGRLKNGHHFFCLDQLVLQYYAMDFEQL